MELTPELVPAYLDFARPVDTPEQREERAARLRARITDGTVRPEDVRVQLDAASLVIGSLWIQTIGSSRRFLHCLGVRSQASSEELHDACKLIPEALAVTQRAGATSWVTRVPDDRSFPQYEQALSLAGFEVAERRVEFTADLHAVPTEKNGPISWRNMREVPLAIVHALLEDILQGQPHSAFSETPAEMLRQFLSSADQTTGPECVDVGFIDEQPAALVIAQVQPTTGWGTLTEMGLASPYRGRGLGALVQQHGFSMLRARGGTHYRDGTSEDNLPMLRIFVRNGCTEHSRMTEWIARTAKS